MDAAALTRVEERKVRAARRFGRIGLAITIGWMLLVPASVIFGGLPAAGFTTALAALYLAALGLHVWRIRRHVRSLGSRAPLWFVVAASVVGLAITLVGLASSFIGDAARVGSTARAVLGRVLREAMTNVLRHAEPSRCTADGTFRLDAILPAGARRTPSVGSPPAASRDRRDPARAGRRRVAHAGRCRCTAGRRARSRGRRGGRHR